MDLPRDLAFVLVLLHPLLALAAESELPDATLAAAGLTPTGAEKAGSADGSIPAWNAQAPRTGFASEAPILTITSANWQLYEARLPEGQRALFRKYPDYRMAIYPAHRSAALPDEIYANIARNRRTAHAGPGGIRQGIVGAAGGIPFPQPKNGTEAVWNHLLGYWGEARDDHIRNYFMSADGTLTLTNQYREIIDFPFYAKGVAADTAGPYIFLRREISEQPTGMAGRGYLSWQTLDQSRAPAMAWQYLPREHRVRKTPLLAHDTPTPDGGGLESFDDYYLFSGPPDRYDFTLIGKAEMYVPYNNEIFYRQPIAQSAMPHFVAPQAVRYELHRVWVVEGTLAAGQRHLVPKRRLYLDEDSWFALYAEGWDSDGKLWKFSHSFMTVLPELPAAVPGSQVTYDLQSGGYFLGFTFNRDEGGLKITAPPDAALFQPDSLAAKD